jgi:carboxypeptidase family protein
MLGVSTLLLLAQITATASIGGTLRDVASGEPLAGALISIVDLRRSTVTDLDGRYKLENLPPGSHQILVRRIGYAPRTLEALLPPDGNLEITIALRAEPIELGAVDRVDTEEDSPNPDRRIDIASLRDHPLLAEPDAFQALNGGTVTVQPESPSGIHVRGGGADQVAYLLDGIPVFSPYHSGEAFSAWNPDALARLDLSPTSETWDALSGVVSASTRTPGDQQHARAGFSTTQMRLTLDGPLGSSGAGYLWSERAAFPGFPDPQPEPTYLRGETGDRLVKVEAPLAAGRLRLLGYESSSELDAAGIGATRNTFGWRSGSYGGEWQRPLSSGSLRLRFWLARGTASVLWHISDSISEGLSSRRSDAGLSGTLESGTEHGHTALGIRIQTSRTTYRLRSDSASGISLDTRAPLAALFVERSQILSEHVELQASVTATGAAGGVRLSPRTWVYWRPGAAWVVSAGYARTHQFTQSLRNPESVAGAVFPAELFVGASESGVPVARSNEGIVAAEYRPAAGLRVGAQGYMRNFRDVVLVAPGAADPFATQGFTVGSGRAQGFAIDLAATRARYDVLASYGWQRVRFTYGPTSYVPDYGATHALDAGVMVHPSHVISFRIGASGRFGRRVTPLATPFEWESCNMTDRGCEFGGSPRPNPDSLGATRLPGYFRLDLGVRSRWHIRIAGRTTELSLFGTVTNIFDRANVLTVAPGPAPGSHTPVTMRSRAPLVVGVDWAF